MPADAPGIDFWWTALIVLGGGAAAFAGVAALAAGLVRSASWQRIIWQASLLGLLGLVAAEALGLAPAMVALLTTRAERRRTAEGGPTPRPAAPPDRASLGKRSDPMPLGATEDASRSSSALTPLGTPQRTDPAALDAERPFRAVQDPPKDLSRGALESPSLAGSPAVAVLPSARPPVETATWWPAIVWGFGLAAALGRIAWGRWMLLRFRRLLSPVESGETREIAASLARAMRLRRRVVLLEAPGLAAPVAFGLLRPVIVVPARFAADYDRMQQRAILAHELAHVAGRDPFWQLLAELACAVLWWHPLVWWMRGRLRASSEAVADEATLLVPGGPATLADCLVRLGRRLARPRRLGWLAVEGGGFRSSLGQRVDRLLRLPEQFPRAPWPGLLAAARWAMLVVLVLVSTLSTAWARPQASFPRGETTMRVVSLSWQRSLAAVALAAFMGWASPGAAGEDRPHEPKAVAPKEAGHAKEGAHAKEGVPALKRDADRPRAEGERREGERREGDRPRGDREGRPERELTPHQRELLEMRAKLEQKVRELREKLERARPDSDDARELREALENVRREMQKVAEQLGPPRGREGAAPDRARIEQRLEELQRKFRELREAGKADEAERVGREIHDIRARLAGGREGGRPDMPPEERERRMQHLRAAAENLRAAGMPEAAERLLRGGDFAPRGDAPRPGAGPRPEGLEPMMRELVGQMQELRRQMQELREQVHKMKEERK